MSLQKDFESFLSDIEPSSSIVQLTSAAQNNLRTYLDGHKEYADVCENTFLSGSYAKHTAIRPAKDDDNRDVDIVVETSHDTSSNSADVIIELRDALLDSSRYSSAHLQTHSVGINLSKLDIDVVPLASDGTNWFIGNVDDGSWSKTDPKGHLEWSTQTNEEHNGAYKPTVKILKWWRRGNCPIGERWPKGITLEKIIADCFPEDVSRYEDILIGVFQNIVEEYETDVAMGLVPQIEDPKIPENDLASSYSLSDFQGFIEGIESALEILNEEGSTNATWRKILGDRFPKGAGPASASLSKACLLPLDEALHVAHRQTPPWPISARKPSLIIVADVAFPDGHIERITDNDSVIPKECSIDYRVCRSRALSGLPVRWEVVNTGEEAYKAKCPRGEFETSNIPQGGRHEETAYAGRHYVKAYVIKKGRCIAFSKEFFINVE